MPRGDRSGDSKALDWAFPLVGIVLALILAWGIGWLQASEEQKRQKAPAAYAEAAKKDAEASCVGTDPRAVFECVNEKTKSAYQTAHDEQDLSAQQRAASSALVTAVLSFIALVLSGVGVWYVKRTLDATLKAVEDTGNATNAMLRQTELAEREQRPWVVIEAGTPKIIRKGFVTFIFVDVVFKNIGKTVAAGFWPHINSFVSGKEYKDKAEAAFKQWRQPKGSVDRILMPGESWPSTQVFRLREQDLPWFDGTNERMIHAVLQAAAFYFPDGDRRFDARLHTERTFRIGILDSDDPLLAYVLTQEAIGHPYNFEFVTTSCGPRSAK